MIDLKSSLIHRRAVRMALTIFIGVWFYRSLHLLQGFWVILTISIVMQTTVGASLRKGLQRLLGTFAGLLIGTLLVITIHNPLIIDILLVFFLFIAYWMKSFNAINYGIFVIPLTIMVVFLVSAVAPDEAHRLIYARFYDTALGGILAIIATFLILPNKVEPDFNRNAQALLETETEYFKAMTALLNGEDQKTAAHQAKVKLQKTLLRQHAIAPEWRYEKALHPVLLTQHRHFLLQHEKIAANLFALHYLAESTLKLETHSLGSLHAISTHLDYLQHALGTTALHKKIAMTKGSC